MLIRLAGLRDDIAAHLLAQLLHVPSECRSIKSFHALAIEISHFKMHDWIVFVHICGDYFSYNVICP